MNIIGQILKFSVTGVLNTLLDFGIFNLLVAVTGVQAGWPLGLINMLSISAAATNSYFFNRTWTFNAGSERHHRQIIKFVIATAIVMIINSAVLMGVSSISSLIPISVLVLLNIGKILGAVFSATWNFAAYRQWVFVTPAPKAYQAPNPPEVISDMLSIIIPAFNESKRLENRIRSLAAPILNCNYPVQIIIVNDGSNDNTLELAQQMAGEFKFVTCLSHEVNRGKGAAVRTGALSAQGEFIVFTDADSTFSFDHISKILTSLKNGHDIAIGVREGKKHRLEGESWCRRIMGRTFNLCVQALLLPGFSDTQCGLKGFRRQAAYEIFHRQCLQRFAFDVELLTLAQAMHYEIARVGVTAVDCTGSTVNPILAPLQMAADILKVKIGLIFNIYGLRDLSGLRREAGVAFALFVCAMAVRLPWLWQVPRYIDELGEVSLAFDIYLGKILPLHNTAHDIGAMHNYILAGLFKIFGPGIYLPRFYVAVTSALTVVLVYHLGCKIFNRQVGMVAAVLLLTNGMHILVTHMAWSNCTTPLFFVLALLATINARDNKSGIWLMVSALLWAATLQTHSSALVCVMAASIYILSPSFRRQANLKPGWYLTSVLVFLAAYANMIYYNVISRGYSFKWAAQKSYALETNLGLFSYLENLARMSVELMRAVSSTYTEHVNLVHYFYHPLFLLAILLLIIGIRQAWKQQEYLLVLMIGAGLAIIPWINARYAFYLTTRYIMPQIICAILLISLALVTIIKKYSVIIGRPRLVTSIAVMVLVMAACMQPLPYYNYCRQMSETNNSNKVALKIVQIVSASPAERSIVLLDHNLPMPNRPLPTLLDLNRQHFSVFSLPSESSRPDAEVWKKAFARYSNKEVIAILSQSSYERLKPQLKAKEIHSLSFRVIIPKPLVSPQTVYVVRMNGDNGVIANAKVSSHNTGARAGEVK